MEKLTRSRGLFVAAGVCVLAYAVALFLASSSYFSRPISLYDLQYTLSIPIAFALALIFKQNPQAITFILIAKELQLFFDFLDYIQFSLNMQFELDIAYVISLLLPLFAYGILLVSAALAGSKTRRLSWPALLSPAFAFICLILNLRDIIHYKSGFSYLPAYIIEFIFILLTGLAICFSTAPVRQSAPASLNGKAADVTEQIKSYKSLLDQGVLTQEEYDRKKSELLKL